MYLLYVDESGDVGLTRSPSNYFVLSGFVLHELRWHSTLDAIIRFRQGLRQKYGLKLREEIHSADFIHSPGALARINKWQRILLLRDVIDFQASLPDISILNVVVDKRSKPQGYDVFDWAWQALIQRFHNTISHRNFPGPQNPQDHGVLVADRTDEVKLRKLLRKMRRFNPVPNLFSTGTRQLLVDTIVEDPVHRDSLHSYFIQLSDVNAYFLFQKLGPCGYVRRKGARNYFDRLGPALCLQASRTDPQGIVRL
jgi:hypothetical protein